jgi:hypothetical protein
MAAKRKAGRPAKRAGKKTASVKHARKTAPRKAAGKPAAKRKPARKAKSEGAIARAETAVVEIAKGIVPKARKVIKSVSRTISGKK